MLKAAMLKECFVPFCEFLWGKFPQKFIAATKGFCNVLEEFKSAAI